MTLALVLASQALLAVAHEDSGPGVLPLPRSTDFALTDVRGEVVEAADFRGRSLLVYFGYTRCPDVCPLGLRNIEAARELLPEAATRLETVFISVDAGHDTPAVMARFLGRFKPGVVGLTGSKHAVFQAARNYGLRYYAAAGTEIEISHLDYVFVVGPDGSPRDVFAGALPPQQMAARIRTATASSNE